MRKQEAALSLMLGAVYSLHFKFTGDFSGYSDIALGTCQTVWYRTCLKNFDYSRTSHGTSQNSGDDGIFHSHPGLKTISIFH
jgi:D-alanyl-lipoteichoic acid acyltransferase DltB (MBOAT superfamily)